MTSDWEVMRYFGVLREGAASDAWIDRKIAHWATEGFGPWVVEVPGVADFAGFVGLLTRAAAHAQAAGRSNASGRWIARIGATATPPRRRRAAMEDGFTRLGLTEIIAFTAAINEPSRGVMRALGMTHDPAEDFDHPTMDPSNPLRRHVIYRLRR
jgi:ribosomal-protein-alanine N-acetyltransferase